MTAAGSGSQQLGRSGISVSPLGLGCWAIGGPYSSGGKAVGWGEVDDEESIRAIHAGLEMGVNFLDTSDVYGTGHSEEVLARALAGRRDRVVIAFRGRSVCDVGDPADRGPDRELVGGRPVLDHRPPAHRGPPLDPPVLADQEVRVLQRGHPPVGRTCRLGHRGDPVLVDLDALDRTVPELNGPGPGQRGDFRRVRGVGVSQRGRESGRDEECGRSQGAAPESEGRHASAG